MAPFRAEHVGSFLRPKELLERRAELADVKALDAAQDTKLLEIEDRTIKDIVKLQVDQGFHSITDGEFRRSLFWGTFFVNLDGFDEIVGPEWSMYRRCSPDVAGLVDTGIKPFECVVCTGKIKHVGSSQLREWNYLKSLVPADRVKDLKITMPGPTWYHLRYKTGRAYPESVYANDAEYFQDVAEAFKAELQTLYDNGCRNVTIDDPNLAFFCSEKMIAGFASDGEDIEKLLETYIRAHNDSISSRPADMHIGIHLCRGNFAGSRHFSEGGYDRIAKKLFQELKYDTYYLEYDTERAGTFEPLKEVPANKNVVLGLVSSKFPALEGEDELQKRVFEAADMMSLGSGQTREEALKRVCISPQCGFASHHLGNTVTQEDMVAKMQLVRKVANTIWPGEP